MIGEMQAYPQRRSWLPLIFLVGLFALPPLAGWIFFLNPELMPSGTTNNGAFIQPPRPADGIALTTPQGNQFDWGVLRDKWTLVTVQEGDCLAPCQQRLIEVRQMRRALGANRQRLERLLVLLPDNNGTVTFPSLDGLEGTRVAFGDHDSAIQLRGLSGSGESSLEQNYYLIDPRGDLMMRHDTSTLTAKLILKDLETLMKASQSWVKGAQYGHK